MSLSQAGRLFTMLTIGDGLVTQLPAFLISLAAGMLVSRGGQERNLSSEFFRQMFMRPQTLAMAGGFLCLLMFTGLPRVPLLLIAAVCIAMAAALARRETKTKTDQAHRQAETRRREGQRVENSGGRSDGIGTRRRTDPRGRRPARRRFVGTFSF